MTSEENFGYKRARATKIGKKWPQRTTEKQTLWNGRRGENPTNLSRGGWSVAHSLPSEAGVAALEAGVEPTLPAEALADF